MRLTPGLIFWSFSLLIHDFQVCKVVMLTLGVAYVKLFTDMYHDDSLLFSVLFFSFF